ncbi:hypothetical protein [Mucilaginibacter lacusdianchii]|uniref:hypothetical protein n=1 Tax=Mucilaginibacter lacusdianchii TaxID=2684211 RepID=UPI00131D3193|nr:hypothetical protein [Mucilaginibacter sp. JXJ CY 39]
MKNFENLNGSLVIVRPDFHDDPVRQQGKVGVVNYAREGDEIYVGLLNGAQGIYSSQDLMLLKHKVEILQELNDKGSSMKLDDFKALYKIMLLQEKGTSTAMVGALQLAAENPGIWDKALMTAAPVRELEISKSYSR